MRNIFEMYFESERFKDMLNNDIDINIGYMKGNLYSIVSSNEYNLELFKSKTKLYYKYLLEGQSLLEIMMNRELDFKDKILNNTEIIIKKDDYNNKIKEYIGSLNEIDYKEVISIFQLDKEYDDRKIVLASDKRRSWLAKIILKKSFGMEIVNNDKTKNKKNMDYGSKILKNDWTSMFSTYGINILPEYNIIDIDDDNIDELF